MAARSIEPGKIDERLVRVPACLVPLGFQQGESCATTIDSDEVAGVLERVANDREVLDDRPVISGLGSKSIPK